MFEHKIIGRKRKYHEVEHFDPLANVFSQKVKLYFKNILH